MFATCKELHIDDMQYGFTTGRIRMLENRLLDQITLEHIIDAENIEQAIHQIENKYGLLSKKSENSYSYESMLANELFNFFLLIKELAPDKEIVNIFFYKYSFHNLKVLLKSKYLSDAMEMIYFNVGPIDFLELRDIVSNQYLENPLSIIKEKAESKFKSTHNPQIIDLVIDQEYFKWIKNISDIKKLPVLEELIKIHIDTINIKNFLLC
ncbi:MAG: V-type ATPase subunit, partial [Candidatus Firestonebacteria bacterium]|nr:V-type ATPase subunit [Candidatus Firestonebacteria bacterium]